MKVAKAADVKRGISVIWENLQCPICLDLMTMPVSTKCDHQFCRFCMMKLLDRNKKKEASCPVCKAKVTKRSLQESLGFQRLVEGLKNMVQAYEDDTSTDYFTGVSRMLEHSSVQRAGPGKVQCNGMKASSCDGQSANSADSSQSQSPVEERMSPSSVEAKQSFAKLMDLEDSCAVISDKDGFDSGLADMPPDSEKEMQGIDVASTSTSEKQDQNMEAIQPVGAENAKTKQRRERSTRSHDPSHQQEGETDNKSKKKFHRVRKKWGSDPDKILDKRQKRSLEKVSEWLLKISPTDVDENDMDLNASSQHDSDDLSDGGSSSSTIKENKDEEQPSAIKRDDRSRCLEDQVFGVVYRRDRRTTGNQLNRSFPSESTGVQDPPCCGPAEEPQRHKETPKRKTSSKLTPADFVKRPHLEEKEDEAAILNQSEKTDENTGPIKDQSDEAGAVEENGQIELSSHGSNKKKKELLSEEVEDADDSPVFEVPLQRPAKRARTNVGSTWQEVNSLHQDGKGESENGKLSKRKSGLRKNRVTQKKLAKGAKPLHLVSTGAADSDPVARPEKGPLLVETEAQIESYPSSEGQGSPAERATRRSRRLQVFTEEVQGSRKKARTTRSTASIVPDSVLEKAERIAVRAECPLTKKLENNVPRNGCVVDAGIEHIEKIDSSFNVDMEIPCGQRESPAEGSLPLSAVPNTGTPPEDNIQCSFLKSVHPSSQPPQDLTPAAEQEVHSSEGNVACEVIQVEMEEEEKNDTEQDTEQLLKSFKTIKRRSFHLGSPSHSLSNSCSPKCNKQYLEGEQKHCLVNEEMDLQKDLEPSCVIVSDEATNVQQDQVTLSLEFQNSPISKTSNLENFCSSDVVPQTDLSNSASKKELESHRGTAGMEGKGEECGEDTNLDAGKSQEASPSGHSSTEGYADRPDGDTPSGRKRKAGKEDPRSEHSASFQAANSGLLFPAFTASEEEMLDLANAAITDKVLSGVTESRCYLERTSENSGALKPGTGGFVYPTEDKVMDSIDGSNMAHSGDQAGHLPNSEINKVLESSVTPDNLLAPITDLTAPDIVISTGLKQGAGKEEVHPTQRSTEDSFTLMKRKRPQRLESSESESSGEEDELPSLAQLLGPGKSNSPAVQQPVLLSADHVPHQGEVSPADLIKGGPVGPVAPGDTDRSSIPAAPSPEWVPGSQGSVDLFDTPEECEGAVCDTGPSVESSQFSNEIIATQQKVAMQEELRRLERMMALVTEALHKKGDGPQPGPTGEEKSLQHPSSAVQTVGQDLHQTPLCSAQGTEQPSRPKSSPPSALSPISSPSLRGPRYGRGSVTPRPAPGATAGPIPAQPSPSEAEGAAETGRRCSRRIRSLRSSGGAGGNTVAPTGEQEVRAHAAAPPSGLKERRVTPPGGARPEVTTAAQCHSGASRGKMVLVASSLSAAELSVVKKFSSKTGSSLCAQVTAETTHIIIRTDEELVCERTLKYFLGIAGRKWVVSFQWIVECFKQGRVLNEVEFEVQGDVVNGRRHQGPTRARTTNDHKLLMSGYEICFQGLFMDMTTGQLEWMAELCGAKVVKDPLLFSGKQRSTQLVVVQPHSEESQRAHRALQKRATVVSRGWLLDTVATYTLQNVDEYRV